MFVRERGQPDPHRHVTSAEAGWHTKSPTRRRNASGVRLLAVLGWARPYATHEPNGFPCGLNHVMLCCPP